VTAGGRAPAPRGRSILIIDDDEGFRDGIVDLLEMVGYSVRAARNAVEAVPLLPEFRPDVILLDLGMPLLDGESFLRSIHGLPATRTVPIVLISAKDELPSIASRSGATAYLQKPFEAPQLLAVIERVLARGAQP
jgi:two-component system sensor histidine kinase/response regulator